MSIYDKIATAAPVDRLASATRGMKGATWEPDTKLSNVRLLSPPPMRPVPPNTEDLTGLQFGRFRVIGLSAEYRTPGRWVVRCSCSAYEFRKRRALRSDPERLMCSHCDHLVEMVAGRTTPCDIKDRSATK